MRLLKNFGEFCQILFVGSTAGSKGGDNGQLIQFKSQKLLNSCTFPLRQYQKSETLKNCIFDPLSPPLLPGSTDL